MKIIKLMALAAILMPLLFSCSGGSSSAGMLGQLPDKYAQFTEEKAELKKEAENIKTEADKKRFLENFRMVREKLTDLKERDYKRLLQPVIDGNEIMQMFNLQPSREVGVLKQYLKDAVLDNRVANEREPLMELLMKKAAEMGLTQ